MPLLLVRPISSVSLKFGVGFLPCVVSLLFVCFETRWVDVRCCVVKGEVHSSKYHLFSADLRQAESFMRLLTSHGFDPTYFFCIPHPLHTAETSKPSCVERQRLLFPNAV